MRLKFEDKKRQFTQPQLEGAFESYLQDRYQSALDKDVDRWVALMHLSDVIRHDPVAEGVRLSGGDYAAYELFFRSEPRTFINQARFMIAMRKVGGEERGGEGRVGWGEVEGRAGGCGLGGGGGEGRVWGGGGDGKWACRCKKPASLPRFHEVSPHPKPQIFGFQTAELDRVSDGAVVRLLERVYEVFDDEKEDRVDWRTWLVMYALLSKVTVAFVFDHRMPASAPHLGTRPP